MRLQRGEMRINISCSIADWLEGLYLQSRQYACKRQDLTRKDFAVGLLGIFRNVCQDEIPTNSERFTAWCRRIEKILKTALEAEGGLIK